MTLGGPGTPVRRGASLIGSSASTEENTSQDGSDLDLINDLYSRLDNLQPTIPDRVSTMLLESSGVRMESGEGDVRLARLVSLAGQKFLSDVLCDTMAHWKLSTAQNTGLLSKPPSSFSSVSTSEYSQETSVPPAASEHDVAVKLEPVSTEIPNPSTKTATGTPVKQEKVDKRVTLTVEDLLAALRDRGIQVARPPYYK